MPYPSETLFPSATLFPQDVTPPNTLFISGPFSQSSDANPIFVIEATEGHCTFEVRLNGGAWEPASGVPETTEGKSLAESFTRVQHQCLGLVSGLTYKLEARATDAAGNVDPTPALFEWQTLFRIAVVQQFPPDKMAMRIDLPDGTSNRWAEDEPNPENVLSDIEISDEMPGGYKDANGTLARDPRIDQPDLVAYGDVKFYQPGVNVVWQGSLDKGPDTSGQQRQVQPSFLGYQAILEDDQAVSVGFISGDLSKFSGPSLQWQFDIAGLNHTPQGASAEAGLVSVSEANGVVWDFSAVSFTGGSYPYAIAVWYGDGAEIGRVYFDMHADGTTPWEIYMLLWKDDRGSFGAGQAPSPVNYSSTTSAIANGQPSGESAQKGSRYKYVAAYASYIGPAATFQMTNRFSVQQIKVIGTHQLPFSGTWPNVGYTAKQMLEYLINTYGAPLEIESQYIDDDGFIIPEAWYGEGQPLADIAKDIMKYGLYDWFVYHGKRFEYRAPGTYGKFWRAYTAESQLQEVGLDSQRLWKKIKVKYTDVSGQTKIVGPPGSGCDFESTLLEITDPQNPAVLADRTRQDILDMGGIGNPYTAIEIGQRFLEEAQLLNRAGSATISGFVMDDKGIFWPAACVKSGDWISFVDAADPSYRKIVNKSYRHNERSSEIDLDAPASGLEALLERLQVGLISLGVS